MLFDSGATVEYSEGFADGRLIMYLIIMVLCTKRSAGQETTARSKFLLQHSMVKKPARPSQYVEPVNDCLSPELSFALESDTFGG